MSFTEAFAELEKGFPIKRASWLGYWVAVGDDVVMHCKDGNVVHMKDGCDPMFTLSHCRENDWFVVSNELKTELDKIHSSKILNTED